MATPSIPKTLGKRIQKRRKELKLTQEELAFRAKISRAYLGYIEQARNAPSLGVLGRVAKALGVQLKDLL